jgi:hypothetical protein
MILSGLVCQQRGEQRFRYRLHELGCRAVSARASSWSSSMVLHLPAVPSSGEASFRQERRATQNREKPGVFHPQTEHKKHYRTLFRRCGGGFGL